MSHADVLRTIREAEDAASSTISKAESDSSSIIQKARLEATESVQNSRSDSESAAQKIVTDSRAAAEKEAPKVSKEGDASIAAIHSSGEKNRKKALKVILDAFRA